LGKALEVNRTLTDLGLACALRCRGLGCAGAAAWQAGRARACGCRVSSATPQHPSLTLRALRPLGNPVVARYNELGDKAGFAHAKALEHNGALTALFLTCAALALLAARAASPRRGTVHTPSAPPNFSSLCPFTMRPPLRSLPPHAVWPPVIRRGNTLIGEEAKAALRNVKAGSSTLKALYIDDFTAKASESDYDDLA
jgi:hypothetical protein